MRRFRKKNNFPWVEVQIKLNYWLFSITFLTDAVVVGPICGGTVGIGSLVGAGGIVAGWFVTNLGSGETPEPGSPFERMNKNLF